MRVTSQPLVGVATGGGCEVRTIVLHDGGTPVEDFLTHRRLRSDRAELYANLNHFVRAGFVGRGNAFKALHHHPNVWQVAATSHRLLGFRWGDALVLTNGFEKKRQDTEPKHIDLCEERRAAFFRDEGQAS
jgi:hypothetical protein